MSNAAKTMVHGRPSGGLGAGGGYVGGTNPSTAVLGRPSGAGEARARAELKLAQEKLGRFVADLAAVSKAAVAAFNGDPHEVLAKLVETLPQVWRDVCAPSGQGEVDHGGPRPSGRARPCQAVAAAIIRPAATTAASASPSMPRSSAPLASGWFTTSSRSGGG